MDQDIYINNTNLFILKIYISDLTRILMITIIITKDIVKHSTKFVQLIKNSITQYPNTPVSPYRSSSILLCFPFKEYLHRYDLGWRDLTVFRV